MTEILRTLAILSGIVTLIAAVPTYAVMVVLIYQQQKAFEPRKQFKTLLLGEALALVFVIAGGSTIILAILLTIARDLGR